MRLNFWQELMHGLTVCMLHLKAETDEVEDGIPLLELISAECLDANARSGRPPQATNQPPPAPPTPPHTTVVVSLSRDVVLFYPL